jgi:deoxyribonuclease IV
VAVADEGPGALDSKAGDGDLPPGVRPELPDGRRAGVHMPVGLGLVKVARRSAAIGASTLQIFTDNPTAWRRRERAPDEGLEFRRLLAELDLGPVAIHATYLVNLAGPDDQLFIRSVDMVRHELEGAPEFGARFVNVHVGSHRGAGLKAGIERLAEGLEIALGGPGHDPDAPMLVLENSSGGGHTIGSTVEELAMVLDAAAAHGIDGRLGVCLDVAHLWGAGYDVGDPAATDALLEAFERLIGLERLVMIHLNDSVSARGSKHDHHTHLGDGQVGRVGLAHWLGQGKLGHAAFYMEVPDVDRGYDAVNVARLGDLVAGRPLTQGPDLGEGRGKRSASRAASVEAGKWAEVGRPGGSSRGSAVPPPRPSRGPRS